MTLEEQRIAVAEEFGYWFGKSEISGGVDVWHDPDGEIVHTLPDYPNDLNAMAEAEKLLIPAERALYGEIIAGLLSYCNDYYSGWCVGPIDFYAFATITSQQRCEAFLRTRGKWKE